MHFDTFSLPKGATQLPDTLAGTLTDVGFWLGLFAGTPLPDDFAADFAAALAGKLGDMYKHDVPDVYGPPAFAPTPATVALGQVAIVGVHFDNPDFLGAGA